MNRVIFIFTLVAIGSASALSLILFIVYLTYRRINRAITFMEDKTNELKKANDVQSKRDIIDKISQDPLFSKISKSYSTMKDSRQALLERYCRIEEKKAIDSNGV